MRKLKFLVVGFAAALVAALPVAGFADEPQGIVAGESVAGAEVQIGEPAVLEDAGISLQSSFSHDDYCYIGGDFDYAEANVQKDLVNQQRAANGLPELVMDAELQTAAMQRAAEIVLNFDHTRPDGSSCFTITDSAWAENIAAGNYGTTDVAEKVTNSWMNSPGHKANILREGYSTIGVGCIRVGAFHYWVELFGRGDQPESYAGTGVVTSSKKVDYSYSTISFRGSGFNLNMAQEDPEPLALGETYELNVGIPNPGYGGIYAPTESSGYTWKSSNPDAFTVDEGIVSVASGAQAGDTSTITATSPGGHSWSKEFIVKAGPVGVKGVTLDRESLTMDVGDAFTLTATITPSNAGNKSVSWTSSDRGVATVDAFGTVRAVGVGTATVQVKTDDGKYIDTCEVKVNPGTGVTGVQIVPSALALSTGDTYWLAYTIIPSDAANKNVTWRSSDTQVATVSKDGFVTAISAGKATITVTTEADGKTASCVVTVSDAAVTGVFLDKTSLSLDKGESYALKATVIPDKAPNKKVTWKSSDTKVATVDANGKVTAVAPGSATITVTTEDGNKTATCVVSVAGAVSGVTLDKTELALKVDESAVLKATVLPENALNKKVTWKSSDTKVATVDANGKVTAVAPGTATITVTTEDGNKTATCTVKVGDQLVITFVTNGGTAVKSQLVNEGESAVRPADPTRAYYRFTGWYTDASLGIAYDFAQPVKADLTLYAGWAGYSPYRGFTDVASDDWYVTCGLFDYAVDHRFMSGYSGTTQFGPYDTITRAQVICVLWNMAGQPSAGSVENFSDNCDATAYYYDAVRWARSAGVANGYAGSNLFNPNGNVSRQELATFLYNYANKVAKLDTSSDMGAASQISGWSTVDAYAKPAIAWAVDHGLMSGVDTSSGPQLRPNDTAWRASMATMSATFHRDVIGA